MSYRTELSHEAEKDFARLDQTTRRRVRDRMRQLEINPYDPCIGKLLKGGTKSRSSRVGDWRILYYVDNAARTVFVTAIRPRGEAYRNI